jgi:hypothetical protein
MGWGARNPHQLLTGIPRRQFGQDLLQDLGLVHGVAQRVMGQASVLDRQPVSPQGTPADPM